MNPLKIEIEKSEYEKLLEIFPMHGTTADGREYIVWHGYEAYSWRACIIIKSPQFPNFYFSVMGDTQEEAHECLLKYLRYKKLIK